MRELSYYHLSIHYKLLVINIKVKLIFKHLGASMALNIWHLESTGLEKLYRDLRRYRTLVRKHEQQLQRTRIRNDDYYRELMKYAAAKHNVYRMEHILQKNKALEKSKQSYVAMGSVVHLSSKTSHRYILLVDPVQSDPFTNRVSIDQVLGKVY